MQRKVYKMEHQNLYEQLQTVPINIKTKNLVNNEKALLIEQCRELKKDFNAFSKIGGLDAIYCDFVIRNKKKVYSLEYLVIKDSQLFLFEKKKSYDNQEKLLIEKCKYLQKKLGLVTPIKHYILMDVKTVRPNHICIDDFAKNTFSEKKVVDIVKLVDSFLEKNIFNFTINEYIYLKYKINIATVELSSARNRKVHSAKYKILNSLPFQLKKEVRISFQSSIILLSYWLCILLGYYKNLENKNLFTAFIIDTFIFIILLKIIEYIEDRFTKVAKVVILFVIMIVFFVLITKTLVYF